MFKNKTLLFKNNINDEFAKVLTSRVNQYFTSKSLSKSGDFYMVLKTMIMFMLYFIPYFLHVLGFVENVWIFVVLMMIMGLGKAGIGLSVMHDANHGAYSKKRWINRLVGYSLNVVGGNATNWKIQHNVMHHTYTNISGMDEDITLKGGILRFDPFSKKLAVHKWQFLYAWFLYGMMTMSWIFVKDITQFIGYTKSGMLSKMTSSVSRSWIGLILTKIIYYTYTVIIPILVSPFNWWTVVLGFLLMHYVAGFVLAIIFQPAHVMEVNTYEDSSKTDVVEENWFVHQLKTTCNFAERNKLLSWYAGGLNYQIEHHLFPNICHIHYPKLSKIVRKTAEEFNVPYHSYPTLLSALISHGKMLYTLGR